MDLLILFKALIMGIVEGLTEFLPISSTGHLILTGELIEFKGPVANVFEVVIQLGAILAVCWEYRQKIGNVTSTLTTNRYSRRLALNLIIAFIPAAVVGFLLIHQIKAYLFNPLTVAIALIIGGILIIWIEKKKQEPRVFTIDNITIKDSFKIGLAQCLALIPGTSRSGSTIMGAMVFGLERKVATEFSFFLAIPVMFAATIYDVYKNWDIFSAPDLPMFAVGFIAAFLSAFVAIRALLKFISTHTFIPFAWYRIIFGVLILILDLSTGFIF